MYPAHNAVYGVITGGARSNNPPNYFYLGVVVDNNHLHCAELCLEQNGCAAFALHLSDFHASWANQCYGRSDAYTTMRPEVNVYSGKRLC